MTLPPSLLFEMRLAFTSCARRSGINLHRSLSTFRSFQQAAKGRPSKPNSGSSPNRLPPSPRSSPSSSSPPGDSDGVNELPPPDSAASKELVQQQEDRNAVEAGRRSDVPMKIIPKAELNPNVRLTPRERLHIEVLTRRAPPLPEKRVYRERLLIYHWGYARENFLAILKVSALVACSAVTFVIGPAHVVAGTPVWLTGLIFLGGFVPIGLINWLTKPMVSRVFLQLPPNARQTPKQAMEYARNLPGNAELDIRFLRPWALEGNVQTRLKDLQPAESSWLRAVTFKWTGPKANKSSSILAMPSEFFVAPKSASGRAARDTIPGVWESVYKRLSGVESGAVAKWKR